MKKVFGIQFIFSTEEAGLWWDSDMHHHHEGYPEGKYGWGFKLALRGGDVVQPIGVKKNISTAPPYIADSTPASVWWNPKYVWRWRCRIPVLPFLSVALGTRGFYIGAKDYPLDGEMHPNYLRWNTKEQAPKGGRALCFSASIRKTRVI